MKGCRRRDGVGVIPEIAYNIPDRKAISGRES